jgi:hypothetical protein
MSHLSNASDPILLLSASKARSFGIAAKCVGDRHNFSGFFTVWLMLCSRLDALGSDWQVRFADPVGVSDYITMRCSLTIDGISREATGSDKGCLIQVGSSTIGVHAPERAMLNSFCNAAAQFGVLLPFGMLKGKKPPDANREDLMEVVKMLRKLQRKHTSFMLFGWSFQPFAKPQRMLEK